MARTLFLILLLLNIAALAWMYVTGEQRNNAGREPQRSMAQLAAERIHVLAPVDVGLSVGAATASSPTAQPAPVAAAEICVAYAGASVSEAQQLAKSITEKLPAARIAVKPVVPPSIFEMVIAGLPSRPAAEARLAELKQLGLDQGVTIRADDTQHFTLVIASYAQRAAAVEALKAAGTRGIRAAVITERKPAAEKSTIEVRGSDVALKKLPEQLPALKKLNVAACAAS